MGHISYTARPANVMIAIYTPIQLVRDDMWELPESQQLLHL